MQLSGIRVVDLSRILSGPFCSMFLADMGAEVIKIEDVEDGDPVRKQGATRDGFSLYFASFNRNKRSLTLNLRSVEGKAILRKLIATADVVLDNFRPGVMERLGLGPDVVTGHGDRALGRRHDAGEHAHGGRLAGAVAPQQGGGLSGVRLDMDAGDRLHLAEADVQAPDVDDGFAHSRKSVSEAAD